MASSWSRWCTVTPAGSMPPSPFERLVGHHHDLARALGRRRWAICGTVQHAVDRLAAGHRHGVVEQDLVGDARLGGDGCADRQQARVEVGAVARVDASLVECIWPGHALAPESAAGIALRSIQWRPMPASAREPSGTRVEVLCGQPEQNKGLRSTVRRGRAASRSLASIRATRAAMLAHVGRQLGLLQAARDGLGDQRRRQFVVRRQQPVAARQHHSPPCLPRSSNFAVDLGAHVLAPVVQLFA